MRVCTTALTGLSIEAACAHPAHGVCAILAIRSSTAVAMALIAGVISGASDTEPKRDHADSRRLIAEASASALAASSGVIRLLTVLLKLAAPAAPVCSFCA